MEWLKKGIHAITSVGGELASFPYSIESEKLYTISNGIWNIHSGVSKKDNTEVSVFIHDLSNSDSGSKQRNELAKRHWKRLKSLRHPQLLKYIDGIETKSKIVFVTEPVVPLVSKLYTDFKHENNLLMWGLFQIATCLLFINENCRIVHCNLRVDSVFITRSMEWRLSGFEFACNAQDIDSLRNIIEYSGQGSPLFPPELSIRSYPLQQSLFSIDSWFLAVFIHELFIGTISSSYSLKSPRNATLIPYELQNIYASLLNDDPQQRLSLKAVLEYGQALSGWADSEFIKINLILDTLQVKSSEEKDAFFSYLNENISNIPYDIAVYRFMPLLMNAVEFGGAGAKALEIVLKFSSKLNSSDKQYQTVFIPFIVRMFSSTSVDKSLRLTLMQNAPAYIETLPKNIVNDKIYTSFVNGFYDASAFVREMTVKSSLSLAPKLSSRTLNSDLLKHLAKMQVDQHPGIRANTTICLGKLSRFLDNSTIKKVLVPAFGRALRDPFGPSRTASLAALAATSEFYDSEDCAMKILPTACFCLIDQDGEVRNQAFKTIEVFIKELEKNSEKMMKEAEAKKDGKSDKKPEDEDEYRKVVVDGDDDKITGGFVSFAAFNKVVQGVSKGINEATLKLSEISVLAAAGTSLKKDETNMQKSNSASKPVVADGHKTVNLDNAPAHSETKTMMSLSSASQPKKNNNDILIDWNWNPTVKPMEKKENNGSSKNINKWGSSSGWDDWGESNLVPSPIDSQIKSSSSQSTLIKQFENIPDEFVKHTITAGNTQVQVDGWDDGVLDIPEIDENNRSESELEFNSNHTKTNSEYEGVIPQPPKQSSPWSEPIPGLEDDWGSFG